MMCSKDKEWLTDHIDGQYEDFQILSPAVMRIDLRKKEGLKKET